MRRVTAFAWVAAMLLALGHLGWVLQRGVTLETDLISLLAAKESDATLSGARDAVAERLSRRMVLLVGHPDAVIASATAGRIASALIDIGAASWSETTADQDTVMQAGRLYFAHRGGLLSSEDRRALLEDRGDAVANRALAKVFGLPGGPEAGMVRDDPFLLLPAFLQSLPTSTVRRTDDGSPPILTRDGKSWAVLDLRIQGEPYAMAVQERVTAALDRELAAARMVTPAIEFRRLGAVFFAREGAKRALNETTTFALISIIAVITMILVVFRATLQLGQCLLTIGTGVLTALSVGLWLFPRLHVVTLLFGSTLIGVTVDYALHYCCEVFGRAGTTARQRLHPILPALLLGFATTVIGYATLFLAPFPGLHQIAAFSLIGVAASFITVLVWLPVMHHRTGQPPAFLSAACSHVIAFWHGPAGRRNRIIGAGLLTLVGVVGLAQISPEDDIRAMQLLSSELRAQQKDIQKIVGLTMAPQYFLVRAPDTETALRRGESLAQRLDTLVAEGTLGGYVMPAAYVPSVARQRENALLVNERLHGPLLERQATLLGLPGMLQLPEPAADVLTFPEAAKAIPALRQLDVSGDGEKVHAVLLDAVNAVLPLHSIADELEGIRFMDPAGDVTKLLETYRLWVVILVALSATLMLAALSLRYGLLAAARVMLPPIAGIVTAPALVALAGGRFTFFDAMALMLVLSIGMDYAVFCAESGLRHLPVTLVAVTLAAATTILSFGLLTFSGVPAIHGFGTTILLGIAVVWLLAPIAATTARGHKG